MNSAPVRRGPQAAGRHPARRAENRAWPEADRAKAPARSIAPTRGGRRILRIASHLEGP